jgi:hypothetical protein
VLLVNGNPISPSFPQLKGRHLLKAKPSLEAQTSKRLKRAKKTS